jgi:5-formyltetrahydrofolate cyclo-ligase
LTTTETLRAAKRAARAVALERRRSAKAVAGPDAPRAALQHLLSRVTVPAGAVVSGYWPMADEFDDRPLLTHFATKGHACALPVVVATGAPLVFRRWQPGDALVPSRLGIAEPSRDAPALDPTVLLVPLLAFDGEGNRLGYGGGFYDQSLATLRARGPVLAIGVAFAGQAIDQVPHGPRDQRLDWIVTEQGARAFPQAVVEANAR